MEHTPDPPPCTHPSARLAQTEVFTVIGTRRLMENIHAEPDEWRELIRLGYPMVQYAICYQETLTPGRPPQMLLTIRPTINPEEE